MTETTRMLFQTSIFCLILTLFAVECAILSYNNKYSNRQKLHSIKIENGRIDIESRYKRNAATGSSTTTTIATPATTTASLTPSSSSKGEPEISVHTSVLIGTQTSNQAFIHWIGKGTSERIIVLTCTLTLSDGSRQVAESQVWRSDNYGTSFNEIPLGKEAKISYLYTFPQNEKKLLFTDVLAKTIYVTDDELNTFKNFSAPVEPDILLPHPTDENKILLYSLNQRKLYVSTDFAKSWNLLLDNVLPNFYWGVKGIDTDTDIVHMEIEAGMPSQASYKTCIIPDCKNLTSDQVGPFLADTLIVHKQYIFVQKSSSIGSENYMMVSYNRSAFQRAYFPGDLQTDDFMLLNLDDGQVFVAVNHGDFVNLYLSEVTGQYYVLSFINIYHIMRLGYFEIDFHEVQGMNWTFLVNKREPNGVTTYVSFDKGGNWSPLTLNKSCTGNCSLLLEVKQSAVLSSMLSQENAPGIILAHGMVDKNLQETTVFTSSDGGATWLKAVLPDGTPLVGRYRFNILDQGSILTAVPDGLLTSLSNNTVFYSYDEGKHWNQQQFDSKGLIVKGVLTEPGSLTMVESVFGHDGAGMPWTVVKLNFSNALSTKCEEKDYKDWYPKDYNNNNSKPTDNNCILGQVVVYRRRIPEAKCYNGEDVIASIVRNSTCECTAEDYECDFGYEKIGDDCKQAKWFDDSYSPPECDTSATYGKSQGYRKIPADVCIDTKSNEQKYGKVTTKCTSAAPSKLSIILQASKLPSGKEVVFHLEQAGGSRFDSNYTWNFGDLSKPVEDHSFKNASIKTHIFRMAGHYTVNVTAKNEKGTANTSAHVHIQDPLVSVYLTAPVAGKTGLPVKFSVIPTSSTRMVDTNSDHVHFVWKFGDESPGSLPLLTWNNSVTHVFSKAGTYRMSIEAVNSMSSVYKEQYIQMFDEAEILVLGFSSNVNKYMSNPILPDVFRLRIKQQLAEDLGVKMARLEAVIVSIAPTTAYLFIFPSTSPDEQTITKIRDNVISQVQKGILGVNLLGKLYEAGEIISIISATKLSSPDHPSGPNMKAVYIAAPVLVLVVAVSIVSFFFYRKKLHSRRQYNMLHTQDDSDALLDDDEAPLDLNVDFGTRESTRDDSILDPGGSHLVMVTGGASSDNAENC